MNLSSPVISIVIPTYNRSNDLKRALISVINQTISNFEVLVVDNHSQDDTEEMINSLGDSRISLYKVHNEGNIAVSRNKGSFHAKGIYIAFLDSDDWWEPTKLYESISRLDNGADFVYHPLWIIKSIKQTLHKEYIGSSLGNGDAFIEIFRKGDCIPCSSVVVRLDLFKKIGGFSEQKELITVEDFDCWLRLSKITTRFSYIEKVLGYYWQGMHNTSTRPDLKIISSLKLREIYLDEFINKKINQMPFWFDYNLGRSYYQLNDKKNATKYLSALLFRSSSFRTKAKVCWMLFMSFL